MKGDVHSAPIHPLAQLSHGARELNRLMDDLRRLIAGAGAAVADEPGGGGWASSSSGDSLPQDDELMTVPVEGDDAALRRF